MSTPPITFDPVSGFVQCGDTELVLTMKTARMFAAIAHGAGRPVMRETLLAEVWPEAQRTTSDESIRATVHNLRYALRQGGIPVEIRNRFGGGYSCAGVTIENARSVLLSARQYSALRRLVETHPDDALASSVLEALGV